MRLVLLTVPLLLAVAATARAEPKVITLDHCAKVETSIVLNFGTDGVASQDITAKCTGPEHRDPEVRKTEAITIPNAFLFMSPTPYLGAMPNATLSQ